jgi:hypothetical protein
MQVSIDGTVSPERNLAVGKANAKHSVPTLPSVQPQACEQDLC